nr:hypothetical protein CFP56_72866 [Quercus suber]
MSKGLGRVRLREQKPITSLAVAEKSNPKSPILKLIKPLNLKLIKLQQTKTEVFIKAQTQQTHGQLHQTPNLKLIKLQQSKARQLHQTHGHVDVAIIVAAARSPLIADRRSQSFLPLLRCLALVRRCSLRPSPKIVLRCCLCSSAGCAALAIVIGAHFVLVLAIKWGRDGVDGLWAHGAGCNIIIKAM